MSHRYNLRGRISAAPTESEPGKLSKTIMVAGAPAGDSASTADNTSQSVPSPMATVKLGLLFSRVVTPTP